MCFKGTQKMVRVFLIEFKLIKFTKFLFYIRKINNDCFFIFKLKHGKFYLFKKESKINSTFQFLIFIFIESQNSIFIIQKKEKKQPLNSFVYKLAF